MARQYEGVIFAVWMNFSEQVAVTMAARRPKVKKNCIVIEVWELDE